MRPLLLVCGMDRSGTSAVAGALQKAGFYLGPADKLVPADSHNQRGYFELSPAVMINDRIRGLLGMNSSHCLPLPTDWESYEGMDSLLAELSDTLEQCLGDSPQPLLKDPRISQLLPVYKKVLGDSWESSKAVVCIRNPLDVAASLARRDMASQVSVFGLWLHNTLTALYQSSQIGRSVVLYNDLLDNPLKALQSTFDLYPNLNHNEQQTQALTGTIRRDLNHGSGQDCSALKPELVARAYEFCCRLTREPALLRQETTQQTIDDLHQEVKDICSISSPAGVWDSTFELLVQQNGGPKVYSTRYTPKMKAQSLRLNFEASGIGAVLLRFAARPGTVWIRDVQLTDSSGQDKPISLMPSVNVVPEETPMGLAWNLMSSNGPHFGFECGRGSHSLQVECLTALDIYRATELMSSAWGELVQLKHGDSQQPGKCSVR